jgi:molecular chaperone Hsp33
MTIDCIIPFLLKETAISGRFTKLQNVTRDIIMKHSYPNVVNKMLTELIVLGVTLSNSFKFDGSLTLLVKGAENAPIRFLVVEIMTNGNVRACANYSSEEDLNALTFDKLLGKGYLGFTVDQGENMDQYQGVTDLFGDNFTQCLQHYFEKSEQLDTSFKTAIADNYSASCIMIQKLPKEIGKEDVLEEAWATAETFLNTAKDDELLDDDPKELLYKLFWELNPLTSQERLFQAKCRCSREKLLKIIESISDAEKAGLFVDGKIETSCEFCCEKYTFYEH